MLAAVAAALACAQGCGVDRKAYQQLQDRQQTLQDELSKATTQRDEALAALAGKDRQIAVLQSLGAQRRLDVLYTVQRIQLGNFTGGVNTDSVPGDDAVKVYIEPIDQYGSVVKTPGQLTVELYDLAAPADQNRLGIVQLGVEAVGRAWFGGFGAYHFSVVCPFTTRPDHDEITVRVEFIDYLTGKTFTAQKVVKVRLTPTQATTSAPTTTPTTTAAAN
jgi:hypothetical protein